MKKKKINYRILLFHSAPPTVRSCHFTSEEPGVAGKQVLHHYTSLSLFFIFVSVQRSCVCVCVTDGRTDTEGTACL